jgi:hypothetical protein
MYDGAIITVHDWQQMHEKVNLLVAADAEIMARCKQYDYDSAQAMILATDEVREQRAADFKRMLMILAEMTAICWHFGIVG